MIKNVYHGTDKKFNTNYCNDGTYNAFVILDIKNVIIKSIELINE